MPATSAKQKRFMDAAAHNPEFAKQAGIKPEVAQEFSTASKGKDFNQSTRPDRQGINKPKTDHGQSTMFKKGGVMKSDMKEDMKMDKSQDKAMIKKAFKQHDSQEHKGGKGTKLALKKGGMPMVMKDGKKMPAFAAKKGGMACAPKKMAKGGGIEIKGKTKGKMC
jgi:hypothetical protein